VLIRDTIFIGIVLGLPFGLGTAPAIFRDGDVSWHLAAGKWILTNARIPMADPFSFSAAGHRWIDTEWLAEIIYALGFEIAGYAGVAAIVAATLIALNAIVFFFLERRASFPLLLIALLTMDVVLAPFVLARPHVLAWPLLAGWTIILLKYAEKGRPPPLWSVLILVGWANLHASFALAAPIAIALGLDCMIAEGWQTLRQWVTFGAASLAALLLNANGVAGWVQPFHISGLEMLSVIGEWQAASIQNTPVFFVVLIAGTGALLRLGVRVPIGRLCLLLTTLSMALLHVRHESAFIIIAACILPPLVPSDATAGSSPTLLLLGAVPLLLVRMLLPLSPPESRSNPWHLLAAAPRGLREQPVFNSYSFGGPLILAGIRPYIDGRAEMYGDPFVLDYKKIVDGDMIRFDRAVDHYHIRWTVLSNDDSKLIKNLDSSPEWRRLYSDQVGVIHVRK